MDFARDHRARDGRAARAVSDVDCETASALVDFATQEHRRAIALAYIGDVPRGLELTFARTAASAEDADAMHAMIDALRKAHFAKLGKPVPKRTGPPLRLFAYPPMRWPGREMQ